MADSVVHIDMEDVLNSVRRLVAEKDSNDSEPEIVTDRCFVLTPDHRVPTRDTGFRHQVAAEGDADEDNTEPALDEISEPSIGVTMHEREPSSVDHEDQPAELGQLLDMVSRETEHVTGEQDAFNEDQTPANFTASEYQSMAEAWKNELQTVAKGGAGPDDENLTATGPVVVSLEDRIAELEEAVSRSHDDWEPDGSEPSKKPEIRRHIFEVVDNTQTAAPEELADDAVATPTEADEPVQATSQFKSARKFSDRPEIEQDVHDSSPESHEDTAEETADEVPVLKGLTPIFSHARAGKEVPLVLVQKIEDTSEPVPGPARIKSNPEPAVIAPQVDRLAAAPTGGAEIVQEDDVFLDVEALRSMIGELVREELRGKMGERITHNVRQMVRQEIERALLANNGD